MSSYDYNMAYVGVEWTVCPVCGLPLHPWDSEDDDASAWDCEMTDKSAWWGDVCVLTDPADEVGQLIPALALNNLTNPQTQISCHRIFD